VIRHLLLLLLSLPMVAAGDERILSFHSDVLVLEDSRIEVTETITVRAEGKAIRRGIYRDFPVEYRDDHGNTHEITVEPLGVTRDGLPENFHSRRSGRDIRIYFGSSDHYLEPGTYTYVFRYRANRLLGFFEQRDEIYWNVTGFRWDFPIDKVSATVAFDFAVAPQDLTAEAYTGRHGSRQRDFTSSIDVDARVHFVATRPLRAANGLTVVVTWPKGFVSAPTQADQLVWLLADNRNLLVAIIGFLLLLAYYIPVWYQHGKDPDEGVITTRYEPPKNFSPASLRYIRQMYYDNEVMTAAVVNLAVKGYLEIEDDNGAHALKKINSNASREAMATGEQELYDALFAAGSVVELENVNHLIMAQARRAHKQSLADDYKRRYFRTNGALNIPAVCVALVATVVALMVGNGPTLSVMAMIVLMLLTIVFFAIVLKRPTLRGRQLLDEMLGFKDYLEVAEREELNLRNPPEKTPQLFEAYLPFALALGVEQRWSERFASLLASIRDPNGREYSPSWYSGAWSSANLSKTTGQLSSGLSSAISSTVAPPGTSSGSSGGGFSGGGGGGGGGGGW
jgi:uncharacterized protein (TIGR04222 family)